MSSTTYLGAYTGFHKLEYTPDPCAGGDCARDVPKGRRSSRSPLARINHSYWLCKACTRTTALKSLSDTIRCGDKQRLCTGLRLEKMYPGSKYIPLMASKQDALVVNRFKALGGTVSNLQKTFTP